MATSRQERLSLGDFKTQFSIEGLPPFPDLDSASELRETGESTKTDKGETAALGDDPDNDDSDTEDMTGGNDRSTDTGPTGSPQAIEDHETGDRTAGETCNPGESSAGNGKNDINDTDNASAADDAGDTDDTNDRNVAGGMKGTTAAHDSSVTNGVDDASAAADLNDSNDPNDSNDTTTPPEPTSSASSSAERSKESGSKGLRQGYLPSRAYELLPDLLAGPARRISDRRERDVFLTGALPIWAAALSNVRVRYGGSDLSPNLYSATIAPPASGKSALRYARRYGAPLSEELMAGGPLAEPPAEAAGGQVQSGEEAHGRSGPNGREPGPRDPTDQRLFLAADTSAAAIKERLAENPHGVICETEFRTLSQALESSWGKFADVLLKGFQNETIKMTRSSTGTVTISHPAPSIALAGTPATFEGVISGTADGLFSRFLLYRFDREFEWSGQFGESETGPDRSLQAAAQEFQVGYHRLRSRGEPLRITVPDALQAIHDQAFRTLTRKWKTDEEVPRSLQASLTRAGLQAVKIAVVLRGIRLVESGRPIAKIKSVALGPRDMEAGLHLALTYLLHGVRVESRFRDGDRLRDGLTERKRKYLEALPEETFSTGEAKRLASQFNVSERNAQRWLKAWREAGLLAKPKRGTWSKLSPKLGGIAGAQSVISVINDIPALTGQQST